MKLVKKRNNEVFVFICNKGETFKAKKINFNLLSELFDIKETKTGLFLLTAKTRSRVLLTGIENVRFIICNEVITAIKEDKSYHY